MPLYAISNNTLKVLKIILIRQTTQSKPTLLLLTNKTIHPINHQKKH